MRLIDADALITGLSDWMFEKSPNPRMTEAERHDAEVMYETIEKVIRGIEKMPSIGAVNHTADYDEKNDILFVHLSPDNSNSYGEEIDKNIIIMRDMDSNEITGVMLYGFNKYAKHGRWIDETFKPWGLVYHPYKCDQCGDHSEADFNFCPSCGARMDGEQNG